MRIWLVFGVILMCVMFGLVLRVSLSTTQKERQKILLTDMGIFGLVFISGIVALLVMSGQVRTGYSVFFIFVLSFPQLLALFIKNYRLKGKKPLFAFRVFNFSVGQWLSGVGGGLLLLFMMVGAFMPHTATVVDGNEIFDTDISFSQVVIGLYSLCLLVWLGVLVFQKVRIYPAGLFYNSFWWEWSDFESYSWGELSQNKKYRRLELLQTLSLIIETPLSSGRVTLFIPVKYKEQIELLLAQTINPSVK